MESRRRGFKKLKKIIVLSCCAILFMNLPISFGQEMEFLKNTVKSVDNCPISHIFASRLYVPATVKIFHDYTPDLLVHTNSTTPGAQINPDGSTNTVYLETIPNSTAQFTIQVLAKYHDSAEHPIFIEYWSQNQQIAVEQFSTSNSQFCRDIMIDTGIAPQVPDVGSAVQKIVNSYLGQLISTVGQNSITLYYALIIFVLFAIIMIIILVIQSIKLSNFDSGRTAADQKMNSLINTQVKKIATQDSNTKLFSIEITKAVNEIKKTKDEIKDSQNSFENKIENTIRSAMLDMAKFVKGEKKEEVKSEQKQDDKEINEKAELVKEEVKIPEKVILPEEIPEKSLKSKIVEVVKEPTKIFSKETPKVIKSQQEFYEKWSKETDIDVINKRYRDCIDKYEKALLKDPDLEAQNEAYALYQVLTERNEK